MRSLILAALLASTLATVMGHSTYHHHDSHNHHHDSHTHHGTHSDGHHHHHHHHQHHQHHEEHQQEASCDEHHHHDTHHTAHHETHHAHHSTQQDSASHDTHHAVKVRHCPYGSPQQVKVKVAALMTSHSTQDLIDLLSSMLTDHSRKALENSGIPLNVLAGLLTQLQGTPEEIEAAKAQLRGAVQMIHNADWYQSLFLCEILINYDDYVFRRVTKDIILEGSDEELKIVLLIMARIQKQFNIPGISFIEQLQLLQAGNRQQVNENILNWIDTARHWVLKQIAFISNLVYSKQRTTTPEPPTTAATQPPTTAATQPPTTAATTLPPTTAATTQPPTTTPVPTTQAPTVAPTEPPTEPPTGIPE